MGFTKIAKLPNYGIVDLTIYTDHQSLVYSISDKNPNTKLKRWKNFIMEFGAEIKYKPGKENIVADALSRQQINYSGTTVHSMISSPTETIDRVHFPLNRFKNQFEIIKPNTNSVNSKTIFPGFSYHLYNFSEPNKLIENLGDLISKKHINALFCTEETFFVIKKLLVDTFTNIKFIYTSKKVTNVVDLNDQINIVVDTHKRDCFVFVFLLCLSHCNTFRIAK